MIMGIFKIKLIFFIKEEEEFQICVQMKENIFLQL